MVAPMQIVTWNVNSLRVRLPQLLDWLGRQPARHRRAAGDQGARMRHFRPRRWPLRATRSRVNGQKTYNGVAILARNTAERVGARDSELRRSAAARAGGELRRRAGGESVRAQRPVDRHRINTNTNCAGSRHCAQWLRAELAQYPRLVVLGRFQHCARGSRRARPAQPGSGSVHGERAGARGAAPNCCSIGFADVFRQFDQPPQTFSWWDYRAGAFRRNNGLRIDLILASAAAGAALHRLPHRQSWRAAANARPIMHR